MRSSWHCSLQPCATDVALNPDRRKRITGRTREAESQRTSRPDHCLTALNRPRYVRSMERIWAFEASAITAVLVDFLDPALADQPDIRERGVRLEIRPMTVSNLTTIYSSPMVSLKPAVVRIDLLESAPHKADRMHFHPEMVDGEPGDRTFDEYMAENPIDWLRSYLTRLHEWVGQADGDAVAEASEVITREAASLLEEARQPWPGVVHDERGLVVG